MSNLPIFDACTLFGPWPQHPADLTVESLIQIMAKNGIVRSLATATTGIFYDYRQGNSETLQAAQQHPQQLFPVATLDPRAYPECMAEAERRAHEGFRLFRFFPDRQQWPLHFAPFQELLRKCDELGVPVAVTISHAGDCTELADAVTFTQAPLLLAGVVSANLGEALAVMRSDPKFHLETVHLLAPGALEAIRDNVPSGAERMVFASYSPLRYLSAALGPVLASTLSDEHKALVLGGNLKRLLTK
ncbi:MAG: amidohydrolase family protein [Armatimonadota bacterium]|nr:amidohydrolase family protein [Armatimonadota bacterium]